MITVKACYEQDPETKTWTVTVPDEPGVVSQGKTLNEAYSSVMNAYAVMTGLDKDEFSLKGGKSVWHNRKDLTPEAQKVIRRGVDLRILKLEVDAELERNTSAAVDVLNIKNHLSFREVGSLLGITGQRVEQISRVLRNAVKPKVNN